MTEVRTKDRIYRLHKSISFHEFTDLLFNAKIFIVFDCDNDKRVLININTIVEIEEL